jgi:hypothetical protein
MSTSPSSEKTPLSIRLETKTFDKFDVQYCINLQHETRREWIAVTKLPDGTTVDTAKTDWMKNLPPNTRPYQDWIETDKDITCTYVVSARCTDDEGIWREIVICSTPDGPILGCVKTLDTDLVVLLDPCIVRFDDIKGTINLLPIFNVARELKLFKSAIRSMQAPAEPIVAIYPGFQLQNKMFKYQLKARVAVTQSEPLNNTGDAVTA